MRQLLVSAAVMVTASLGFSSARADKVEVKGIHLCCGSCEKAVKGILAKVEGVSDISCDRAAKSVTFTAADAKTAKKAFNSLLHGGFFGEATADGKTISSKNKASKEKANQVTVKNVHVCCNSCKVAIQKIFKGATISYTGKGPLRNVTISGENLEPAQVLDALRKGGLNGSIK